MEMNINEARNELTYEFNGRWMGWNGLGWMG